MKNCKNKDSDSIGDFSDGELISPSVRWFTKPKSYKGPSKDAANVTRIITKVSIPTDTTDGETSGVGSSVDEPLESSTEYTSDASSSSVFLHPRVSGSVEVSASTLKKRRGGWPKGRKRKPEPLGWVKTPKAPRTAYVCFLNERRKFYKDTQSHLSFAEVTKILGAEWSASSEKERSVYMSRSELDKHRYRNELQMYRQSHDQQMLLRRKRIKCNPDGHQRLIQTTGESSDFTDEVDDEDGEDLHCRICDQWFSSLHNKREHLLGRPHLRAIASRNKRERKPEESRNSIELSTALSNQEAEKVQAVSSTEDGISSTEDEGEYDGGEEEGAEEDSEDIGWSDEADSSIFRRVSDDAEEFLSRVLNREKEVRFLRRRYEKTRLAHRKLSSSLNQMRSRHERLVRQRQQVMDEGKILEDEINNFKEVSGLQPFENYDSRSVQNNEFTKYLIKGTESLNSDENYCQGLPEVDEESSLKETSNLTGLLGDPKEPYLNNDFNVIKPNKSLASHQRVNAIGIEDIQEFCIKPHSSRKEIDTSFLIDHSYCVTYENNKIYQTTEYDTNSYQTKLIYEDKMDDIIKLDGTIDNQNGNVDYHIQNDNSSDYSDSRRPTCQINNEFDHNEDSIYITSDSLDSFDVVEESLYCQQFNLYQNNTDELLSRSPIQIENSKPPVSKKCREINIIPQSTESISLDKLIPPVIKSISVHPHCSDIHKLKTPDLPTLDQSGCNRLLSNNKSKSNRAESPVFVVSSDCVAYDPCGSATLESDCININSCQKTNLNSCMKTNFDTDSTPINKNNNLCQNNTSSDLSQSTNVIDHYRKAKAEHQIGLNINSFLDGCQNVELVSNPCQTINLITDSNDKIKASPDLCQKDAISGCKLSRKGLTYHQLEHIIESVNKNNSQNYINDKFEINSEFDQNILELCDLSSLKQKSKKSTQIPKNSIINQYSLDPNGVFSLDQNNSEVNPEICMINSLAIDGNNFDMDQENLNFSQGEFASHQSILILGPDMCAVDHNNGSDSCNESLLVQHDLSLSPTGSDLCKEDKKIGHSMDHNVYKNEFIPVDLNLDLSNSQSFNQPTREGSLESISYHDFISVKDNSVPIRDHTVAPQLLSHSEYICEPVDYSELATSGPLYLMDIDIEVNSDVDQLLTKTS